MPDFATDPYTQVYDRLWQLLESEPSFAERVRIRNRVNLQSDDPNPGKLNTQDADMPEVSIRMAGGAVEAFATSSSAILSETYQIGLATADARPQKTFNPVKFAIVRALARGDADLGLDFVHHVSVQSLADALDGRESNAGTIGWRTLVSVSVEMHIDRAVLTGATGR